MRPLPMAVGRRAFLRGVFLGGGAGAPGGARADGPPRALVVVFLRGAMDGLNAVVPYGDDDYRRLRPTLALPAPDAAAPAGRTVLDLDGRFGLHPALEPLLPRFREGSLAVVHAVGTDDRTRSHFEAQDQLEHGAAAGQVVSGGWLGRFLRAVGDGPPSALDALAIGETLPESLRGAPAAGALRSLDEVRLRGRGGDDAGLARALETLHATGDDPVRAAGRETLALLRRVRDLGSGDGDAAAAGYGSDPFARALLQVGRLLRAGLGVRAACVDLGGFDTHFGQGNLDQGLAGGLAGPLRTLADGLAAFARHLGPRLEDTTVVVLTEFGRRAYENTALGTDHGSGSALFLLGGGLRGGRVHGRWPGLAPDALHEGSDLAVTTDLRQVLAEILVRRFRLPDPAAVFPGLPYAPPGVCS